MSKKEEIINLINLINEYENNINKTYFTNKDKLKRYEQMLNNIIEEFHKTSIKRNW